MSPLERLAGRLETSRLLGYLGLAVSGHGRGLAQCLKILHLLQYSSNATVEDEEADEGGGGDHGGGRIRMGCGMRFNIKNTDDSV
ncbi:hypothetical protein K440DRAFT_619471 [Wilcoxina mikolae CBS 423.85]|nr:hypothetical protein K440DRAFT_619471 [Wilcoxina mikolae CBS 423.85]